MKLSIDETYELEKLYTLKQLYDSIYELSLTDKDFDEYRDIIKENMLTATLNYNKAVQRIVIPKLSNANSNWSVNFRNKELCIND